MPRLPATPARRGGRSSTPGTERSATTSTTYSSAGTPPTPDRPATTTGQRPRPAPSTATGPLKDQQIVCALTESRGVAPTVGLAFVNLSTTEAVLCQIADNQTYVKTLHKLHVFDPSEILVAALAGGVQRSKLLQVLEANLAAGAPIRAIHRKYWDEGVGLEYVQDLAFEEDVEAIKVALGGKFFANCCFAAAMKYIETQLTLSFAFHSMRVKYEPSEGAMMIDVSTIQALELIQNAQNSRSADSLFGLLDQTLTKMGARLLRTSILQPLIDQEVIEKRHDALEELTTHAEIFVAVRRALKGFQDVDRTLTNMVIIDKRASVHHWEQSINNVLAVKHYIRSVPAVYDALAGATSELLINIRQFCSPDTVIAVARLIDGAINEDVTFQAKPLQLRNQRVYAVKAGVNGLLDVARQTYKEANHDAYQLMLELQQAHELNLDMKYDNPRQAYFVVHAADVEHRTLPDVFINRFRKKNLIECQTLGLVKLNQKILDSTHEVMQLSDAVIQALIESLRAAIAPLFRISDGIAVLDMLVAFAQTTTSHDYTRPEFGGTLALQAARHPIAEHLTEQFVANDVYAPPSQRLQLVTGCNMSGKSTYIRAIALATVLAQIGCFVPATVASLPIQKQLFARLALDDAAVADTSTFAAEMRETAFILHNVTPASLVIIDELGRGTATRDGLAIAVAVAEALVQARALVWFVTHFADLPAILRERAGVATLHLRTPRPDAHRLAMLYQVAAGPATEPHYGLALARAVGLPADAMRVATHVAEALEARAQHRRAFPAREVLRARRRRLVLGLKEQLVLAREGDLGGTELRAWLASLQEEFVRRMWAIDDESTDRDDGRDAEADDPRTVKHESHDTGSVPALSIPLPSLASSQAQAQNQPSARPQPAGSQHPTIARSIATSLARERQQPLTQTEGRYRERPITVSSRASSLTLTGEDEEKEEGEGADEGEGSDEEDGGLEDDEEYEELDTEADANEMDEDDSDTYDEREADGDPTADGADRNDAMSLPYTATSATDPRAPTAMLMSGAKGG